MDPIPCDLNCGLRCVKIASPSVDAVTHSLRYMIVHQDFSSYVPPRVREMVVSYLRKLPNCESSEVQALIGTFSCCPQELLHIPPESRKIAWNLIADFIPPPPWPEMLKSSETIDLRGHYDAIARFFSTTRHFVGPGILEMYDHDTDSITLVLSSLEAKQKFETAMNESHVDAQYYSPSELLANGKLRLVVDTTLENVLIDKKNAVGRQLTISHV